MNPILAKWLRVGSAMNVLLAAVYSTAWFLGGAGVARFFELVNSPAGYVMAGLIGLLIGLVIAGRAVKARVSKSGFEVDIAAEEEGE